MDPFSRHDTRKVHEPYLRGQALKIRSALLKIYSKSNGRIGQGGLEGIARKISIFSHTRKVIHIASMGGKLLPSGCIALEV
jgi:hypothetical protein